jgi:hypothetical protein
MDGVPTGVVRASFGYMTTLAEVRLCACARARSLARRKQQRFRTGRGARVFCSLLVSRGRARKRTHGPRGGHACASGNIGYTAESDCLPDQVVRRPGRARVAARANRCARARAPCPYRPLATALRACLLARDGSGLKFDREWCVVGPDGRVLDQRRHPVLHRIVPRVDLASGTLTVSVAGDATLAPLVVPLERTADEQTASDVTVCGTTVCAGERGRAPTAERCRRAADSTQTRRHYHGRS